MAVTTSFSWVVDNTFSLTNPGSNHEITSLSSGGFVIVADTGADTSIIFLDENGDVLNTVNSIASLNPVAAELDNGNVAVVSQDANSLIFEVFDTNGNIVVGPINHPGYPAINSVPNSAPEVTAVTGGVHIAFESDFGTDTDVSTIFVSNAGVFPSTSNVVSSNVNIDENSVSIATLANGNVAYAWVLVNSSGLTEIRTGVYTDDQTGSFALGTIVDQTGFINRNPSVVALPDGGYAIIYEDNEFQEGGLSMATYTSGGVLVNRFDISGTTRALSNPEATVLANGLVAIVATEDLPDPGGADDAATMVRVVDPTTGQIIIDDTTVTGTRDFDRFTENPEVTTLENGTIAVVHSQGASLVGEILEAVRFTTGDNTSNIVTGDEFIDVMQGGAAADFFYGLENDDRLFGGEGDDWLYGGEGDDILDGDAGADLLFGQEGDDEISGGDDGDFIYGGDGDDVLTGEDGVDWIYGEADDDIILGQDGGDILFGGTGEDQIFGGAETDTIFGEADNDRLYGQDGGDVISGQSGDDQIHGGAGGDFLFGGSGWDTIYGDEGNDQIFGQGARDFLSGGAGRDDLHGGDGRDTIYGGDDGDSLFGGTDTDLLFGDNGGDVLNGGDGFDQLDGGAGGDFLFGDAGIDTLNGGTGNDQLYGGSNGMVIAGETDIFVFNTAFGIDTIHDYEVGVDTVGFIGITGLTSYADLTVSEVSGNAVVSFGMNSVTFIGVSQATLDANSGDLIFS